MSRIGSFVAGLALAGAAAGVLYADERDTLCARGYSASVRPSEAWSQAKKWGLCLKRVMGRPLSGNADSAAITPEAYREAGECMGAMILDHIVPLCLGGDPRADSNLQLQERAVSYSKDHREAMTCRAYCEGRIDLDSAQRSFKRD